MRVRTGVAAAVAATAVAAVVVMGRSPRDVAASPADAAAEVAILSAGISFLEQRVALDPENLLAAGHLIDRYLLRYQLAADAADVDRAEAEALRASAMAPERAPALARLSSIHLAQHEFPEAFAAAEQAVTHDSADGAALSALFDASMATGRYSRAEWALGRLPLEAASRRIRASQWHAAHGRTDIAYGELARTCDQFRAESLRAQLLAWCLTELAGLRQEREGSDAARTTLRDALRVQPGYRGAIEALADLAHAEQNWAEAIRLYDVVVADAHPDIYLRLAECHRASGNIDAAQAAERRFLQVATGPGAEALHAHSLALHYASQPRMRDAALRIAQQDVQRRPAVDGYDVLSWVHFQRGELDEALVASDSAIRWGSPSPTMQYRRARILQAMGRTGEGDALMREALQRPDLLDPDVRADIASTGRAAGGNR